MSVLEIPLSGSPKTFGVSLPSGTYRMRTLYCDASNGEGGWVLDIADASGAALVSGIPLVTGADLLEQYAYLGISGALYVATDGDPSAVPTFANLGTGSHLYLDTSA